MKQDISSKKGIHAARVFFFEMSNMCNYSYLHKKCPVAKFESKIVLPTKLIKKGINELSLIDYDGTIVFHNYNEPLIDPRLFILTQYAKNKCPNAIIKIRTNGFYLTQELADELHEFGVTELFISLYSKSEEERLRKINFRYLPVTFNDFYSKRDLDGRIDIYDAECSSLDVPCYAPTQKIIVRCTGDVGLCCMDWDFRYLFGNIATLSLQDILADKDFQLLQRRLRGGERYLSICARCTKKFNREPI
jgi:sulfatase maturation enzyme AslB (radical SAM superfamily)